MWWFLFSICRDAIYRVRSLESVCREAMLRTRFIASLHPPAAFRAANDSIDNAHIGESVCNGRWHVRVVQNRQRKLVPLQRVLVAGIQQNFFQFVAVLIPYFTGPVRWRVEGYLYLDSTPGTKDVDTLVGGQLGRAGKGRGSLSKIQNAGGEPVGFELRIILHDA